MIIQADAHQIPLADKSVQCVVTSPPYWGLRDYGTATWVGGDEGCDHKQGRNGAGRADGIVDERGQRNRDGVGSMGGDCGKCGATRIDSQIGLEKTPEEYVKKIVAVFAEVWRVLRDDGTCWVNLGDSYSGGFGSGGKTEFAAAKRTEGMFFDGSGLDSQLKPKNLCGIPWRVAFALQAAGWYLRSDIIWSKPNPMPESVTDRPTKAHEYIFLLTKRPRYYFDQDAVREPLTESSIGRITQENFDNQTGGPKDYGHRINANRSARKALCNLKEKYVAAEKWGDRYAGWDQRDKSIGRNIRTVWEIATQPYPEAHFATFPEEIAVRCIKAGTSEKGTCKECGAPWERVTERTPMEIRRSNRRNEMGMDYATGTPASGTMIKPAECKTLGWQPTCDHVRDITKMMPCIVLDPFSGAGTVPLVADKLNRRGIGLELKADYCRMAHNRCYDDAPLLAAL